MGRAVTVADINKGMVALRARDPLVALKVREEKRRKVVMRLIFISSFYQRDEFEPSLEDLAL